MGFNKTNVLAALKTMFAIPHPATADLAAEAMADAIVDHHSDYAPPDLSRFSAYLVSDQNIPTTVMEVVEIDAVHKDDDGVFNTTTHKMTAPRSAWWHFDFTGPAYGSVSGERCAMKWKHGTATVGWFSWFIAGSTTTYKDSLDIYLTAGDTIYVEVQNYNNGFSLYGGDTLTRFSGHELP